MTQNLQFSANTNRPIQNVPNPMLQNLLALPNNNRLIQNIPKSNIKIQDVPDLVRQNLQSANSNQQSQNVKEAFQPCIRWEQHALNVKYIPFPCEFLISYVTGCSCWGD